MHRSVAVRMVLAFAGIALVLCPSFAMTVVAQERGPIVGRLVDEQGEPRRVAGAAVAVLEFATGRPLVASTRKPLGSNDDLSRPDEFLHAVTNARGEFRFDDLPAGTYRLLAQSWPDVEGMPRSFDVGETTILHGSAESVKVGMGKPEVASVKPFGDATMTFETDPAQGNAFLLISRKPPLGDSILGFDGWTPEFLRDLVAVTHLRASKATIVGLPRDATVHASLFAYDDSPGVAGGEYSTSAKGAAVLRIYAGWSDGHGDPPERLAPLVAWMERTSPDVETLYPFLPTVAYRNRRGFGDDVDPVRLRQAVLQEPRLPVDLGEAGKWTAADILAATAYRELREYRRELYGETETDEAPPESVPSDAAR